MQNPFDVQTPENLSTSEMLSLFVHENTDYWQVQKAGHTFLTGPRGAGKSMFFRFMEPDCQCKSRGVSLSDLEYYAAYIPVKETELNITELMRLNETRHATIVLNEHLLVTHVATKIFVSLLDRSPILDDEGVFARDFCSYSADCLVPLALRCGWAGALPELTENQDIQDQFRAVIELFDNVFAELNSYIKRLAFQSDIIPYSGALFGYSDFLVPLVKELRALSFMPDAPIFLLIDDADNLNEAQTSILNSWVARRTTGYLSLKVAYQEREYKTYTSSSGQRIEAPHDYSEFNISDKYTSNADNYRRRIQDIIKKRLALFDVETSPKEFFPNNLEQEKKIEKIGKGIAKDWEENGRGHSAADDVLRYARPEYIRRLGGQRKSGSTYSYAGFSQLVHLSSGIIRHFLEASSLMYAETVSRGGKTPILEIPHSIQNKTVRYYSDDFLFSEFSKVEQEEGDDKVELDKPAKLKNLINALGGMFKTILMNEERSERRVFSIAFSNGPDAEVQEVLDLGVKYGYLHRSTIGDKEGTGRVPLYILTRRLAPTYGLDPTGFAGYKFVQNDTVREAMYSPNKMKRLVERRGFDKTMSDDSQGKLFHDD